MFHDRELGSLCTPNFVPTMLIGEHTGPNHTGYEGIFIKGDLPKSQYTCSVAWQTNYSQAILSLNMTIVV